MPPRHIRPSPAPRRAVAPFHSGPQAMTATTAAAGSPSVHAPNAALLIDFDNVTMGIRSDLQAELHSLLSSDIIKGKVAVRRAYADWRRYPSYIVPLTESSIDLIFAPAYGTSKKNATDIRLAIDAMELVFTRPEIGTIILLSGDSDFSSLVIKLKEYGKYVIGVGIRESSSDLLVMNCDEYYSYNALAGLVKNSEEESTRWDPWELVKESVTRMKRNGDVMRSDRLKQVMQEIDNSFDEKNLGHPKFSRFVQEASQKGLLKVTKLESGQLEIDMPDGAAIIAAPDASPETESASDARRERERDDRRGRRGRRGRGRDRERGDETRDEARDEARDESVDAAGETVSQDSAEAAAVAPREPEFTSAPIPEPDFAAAATVATAATAGAPSRDGDRGRGRDRDRDRGRGRGRDRDREPRVESAAGGVAAAPASAAVDSTPAFGASVAESIGTSGERLTRSEAFDLVRRAVESLVQGEQTTSASAVRQAAHGILRRDSESLSARNFERVLQDAHDAGMVDLRRRGNDFEVARAADAPEIVEQLKSADQALKVAAALNAPPAPPRGMSHRGVAPRGMGGRKGAGAPSADLLMVGMVPRPGGSLPAATAAASTPVAATDDAGSEAGPVPSVSPTSPTPETVIDRSAEASPEDTAPASAPAPARGAKAAAKVAKAPTKKAAKTAAKAPASAPAKAARGPAKAPAKAAAPPAAKKAAKAPAKKAAKAAKR
ncbi:MAG TPA: NYN domain-containing protein [Gemmatimonas sp.]|nr:NYN domain-containing protein [Gemmatimonas sp.]